MPCYLQGEFFLFLLMLRDSCYPMCIYSASMLTSSFLPILFNMIIYSFAGSGLKSPGSGRSMCPWSLLLAWT